VNDAEAMRLAIELAELGAGDVSPNPLVGAVIVRDGRIVGRGYHRRYGGPHAEIFALQEAGDAASGATMFVTLEPCCHVGKTPACTDAIIEAGVGRVVVALRDPFPDVDGRGIATLREAGVSVEEGLLQEEAARQNEVFLHYTTTGRPFVLLKLAASLDGRIATRTGDSKWISGEGSRTEAHRLRRRHSSVLVGIRTVLADDPELTVRRVPGRSPTPIVIDPTGRIPPEARLLRAGRSPIIVASRIEEGRERGLVELGARVWRIPSDGGRIDLLALLDRLGEEKIDSVLVEGGGETAAAFLDAGLVDKVTVFVAPLLIGGRAATPAVGGEGAAKIADAVRLRDVSVERFGDDLCITGYPQGSTSVAR